MASFASHLYGGAVISSAAAITVYSLGWAGPEQTQMLFFVGVAGSLLPDIDSHRSKPIRIVFSLLGTFVAFLASLSLVGRFPVVELALIWAGAFLLVRYGLLEMFARLTVHRGIWHSWLGAVFAGLSVTNLSHYLAELSASDSWLAGLFVFIGYLTHLCLDEIASVDLLGNRVKRSFGTALKIFSISSPRSSLGMLAAVVLLSLPAPTLETTVTAAQCERFSVQLLSAGLLRETPWSARLRAVLNQ